MSETPPPHTDPTTPPPTGAPAAPAAAPPPAADPAVGYQPPTNSPDVVMGILSYFGILALIPFFAKQDDPLIQWHSKQGLALLVAAVAVFIALIILAVIAAFIHPLLSLLVMLMYIAAAIGVLVLSIFGMIKAANGERWLMPVLGPMVNKTA